MYGLIFVKNQEDSVHNTGWAKKRFNDVIYYKLFTDVLFYIFETYIFCLYPSLTSLSTLLSH